MKCEFCSNPATVHLTKIVNKDRSGEMHLCEAGPREERDGRAAAGIQRARHCCNWCLSQDAALCGPGRGHGLPGSAEPRTPTSGPRAGLGCPHDYEVFRPLLSRFWSRFKTGAARHVGKVPRRHRRRLAKSPPGPRWRPSCGRRSSAESGTRRRRGSATGSRPRTHRLDHGRPDSTDTARANGSAGPGPESDIVVSSRIRLARNLAAFPFTNRATRNQKAGEIEALLREPIAKLDLPTPLDYVNVPSSRPSTASSWSSASSSAASWPTPRGRAASPSTPRDRQHHGQRGGPPAPPGHAQRLRPRRGLAGHRPRRRPARAARHLRLQRRVRLPDRLPDQRRHRHARQRHAAPARPWCRPSRSRRSSGRLQKINLAVRGLYGEGSRASGDFYQISNQVTLGKSETRRLCRDPRGHPADHHLRAAGPRSADAREPAGHAGPGRPGLRHAAARRR